MIKIKCLVYEARCIHFSLYLCIYRNCFCDAVGDRLGKSSDSKRAELLASPICRSDCECYCTCAIFCRILCRNTSSSKYLNLTETIKTQSLRNNHRCNVSGIRSSLGILVAMQLNVRPMPFCWIRIQLHAHCLF